MRLHEPSKRYVNWTVPARFAPVEDSVVVYIKDGSAAIPAIVLRLSEASIPMREVTLARPTLDDVFLKKTGHHIESGDSAPSPAEHQP